VLARLARIFIVLALAGSIGLQWTFLQAVAWTGMVISYAQDAPLVEAVSKTFDGKHPCKLCRQISEGKKSEKRPEARVELKKFEFQYLVEAFVLLAPSFYYELRSPDSSADSRTLAPPVPPPRFLFV
jgi:hypothetical protein